MKNYSFKKKFFNPAGQLLLIGLLSLTIACKDKPARMPGDVLPDGEKIIGLNYDGYTLDTRNVARESIRTSDATYGVIGEFNDPQFGQTKADFLTDFSIGNEVKFSIEYIKNEVERDTVLYKFNNNSTAFSDTWKADSLVLNLKYQFNNWYGDMLSKQKVKIFELNTPLGHSSQEYFHNHDVNGMYDPSVILAEELVHPNYEVPVDLRSTNWGNLWKHPDSLLSIPQYLWNVPQVDTVMGDGFNGHTTKTKIWSFKLNDEITQRFFNFDEATLKSTNAFKDVFNGLYVTASLDSNDDSEGSLTKINLLSTSSSIATNITIHLSRKYKYKNKAGNLRDTTSLYTYTFPINVENVRFNRYKHTLSSNIKIENPEDIETPTADRLYIQGMAGAYTRMQLPEEIINWVDSIGDPAEVEPFASKEFNIVSNVEFFMEIDTTHYPEPDKGGMYRYPIPDQLTIKWKNEKGELVDPIYSTIVNGNKISSPVFGSDVDSKGKRTGIGERRIRYSEDGKTEYLYHFVMRADYFNYIMRNEDGGKLNEKEFYIGPTTPTSNFQRVIIFSGANKERPMKMNIKYFKYQLRL